MILSVTCDSLNNFPPLIHILLFPFVNFQNPPIYYFFEFESFVKSWMWIGNKSWNIFICHLSWLRKLSITHTQPLISICEFSTPYEFIISWVWVICKWLNANWEKIDSIILFFTCHSLINFPPIIHIPAYLFVNYWNPMNY